MKKVTYSFLNDYSRRKFIRDTSLTVSSGVLLSMPLLAQASEMLYRKNLYTVRQIIDLFIKDVPGGAKAQTVDTLKSGSMDTQVTGIVTTMFATIEVIRKTIELGANFIIAHEPTFYNHIDDTSWLKNDDVYQYKIDLLNKHNITVWRNHDYIHSLVPDGVTMGVLKQLDWLNYADKMIPNIITLPATSLKDIIAHVKLKLNIERVRFEGDAAQSCTKVLLMPGAAGGQTQILGIGKVKPDVLICGEIAEWETAEYVRDARLKGDNISLVVLGHIASEEPGSEFMLGWLQKHIPDVKATHIPSGNSLHYM